MTNNSAQLSWIAKQSNLASKSISACLELLNSGATIPFIARYRKEVSGGLDEVELEEIKKLADAFEALEKRKETVLKSIEEQGKLSEELRQKVIACSNLTDLEDIYLPYKSKRETKADKARKVGLEPLAKIIMSQNASGLSQIAHRYVNNAVKTEEEALEGARMIMAEWINERKSLRDFLRKKIFHEGFLSSKLVKGKEEEAEKFRDYFKWEEPIKRMASHRFLAMSRGEKEGFLRVKLNVPEEVREKIAGFFIRGNNRECQEQIIQAAEDAWKRLLHPALETEFKNQLKEKADLESIEVFRQNLMQLLLESPLGQKRVLALDPGFRTGCKLVCLDENGSLLHNETIYPHPPQNEKQQAAKKLKTLVESYKIDAIAIGDGTAGRETDDFVKHLKFDHQVYSYMVNENGASVYSASKIAREEFPDYDVTVRGAVSIGRRLMDPLAELVKIDPKSIGVGQYQHDVNQSWLKEALDRTVENCVNQVGVNLNTASIHLLQYISGLGPKLAERIVEYRSENGSFKSREELKQVNGLGAMAFQQAAGFLRIRNASHPLDNTGIHPERYKLVEKILSDHKLSPTQIKTEKESIKKIDFNPYQDQEIGEMTLADIRKELLKPGHDPRGKRKAFEFDPTIKSIDDLKEGMEVPGLITNITNFGAFVNIGVKQDGLVHISELADRFVKDPNEVVKLNQEVRIKIVEVDKKRSRIQLSMKGLN